MTEPISNEEFFKRMEKAFILIAIVITVSVIVVMWIQLDFLRKFLKEMTWDRATLWAVGFYFSLVIGHVVGWALLRTLRRGESSPLALSPNVPGWALGLIERLVFTMAIAVNFSPNGMAVGVAGWIGLKMAVGWSEGRNLQDEKFRKWKHRAFSALLGSLVSMAFAVMGGMICRLEITASETSFILKDALFPWLW